MLAGKATGIMRGVRNHDAPLVTSILETVDLLKRKPLRRKVCLHTAGMGPGHGALLATAVCTSLWICTAERSYSACASVLLDGLVTKRTNSDFARQHLRTIMPTGASSNKAAVAAVSPVRICK